MIEKNQNEIIEGEEDTVNSRGKSRKKIKLSTPRKIIIGILAIILAFALYKLTTIIITYISGDSYASGVASLNGEAVDTEVVDGEGDGIVIPLKEINFDKLLSINSDTKAWIQGPDSVIDYPVVQGGDNDKYLTTRFNSEDDNFGTLFIDYQNAANFSDDITLIYGHHMKNGSMFASVVDYKSQEYYESHKYLILYTPSQNYLLEPYASTTIDGNTVLDHNYSNKADYKNFIDGMLAKSDFKTQINMTENSKTVVLFTCTYEYDSARYILLCRLTPIN